MKIWALRFLVCALFAIGLMLPTASAQTAAGVIKAGKVDGAEVYRLTADGQSLAVKVGDTLIETDVITTGRGSSVVLVFANGASVRIGSDSKLKIEQFKMDPLDEEIAIAKLTNEPSVSQTSLHLDYGEMVGDVKKLNTSSNFNIKTPIGAAGIRGTTFRIVFRPTGDGRAFNFQLSTAEGLVVFEGTTQGGSSALPVADQQEIVVTAEVDTATGAVTVSAPQSAAPISSDAATQITTAVVEAITQAQQTTTITTNEQQQSASQTPQNTDSGNSGSQSNDNSSDNNQSDNSQSQNTNPSNDNSNQSNQTPTSPTQQPTNPPQSTTRPAPLTPGAGG